MLLTLLNALLLVTLAGSNAYEVAKSKCMEYASIAKIKGYGTCNRAQPLIVGGEKALPSEFPHMALIGYGDPAIGWQCGGSLIANKFVLTAAHCEKYIGHQASTVKVGMINRDDVGNEIQQRRITKFIKHPKYKRPLKYYDIAVIELDLDVELSDTVFPICLNYEDKQVTSGVSIGFGKTDFLDDEESPDLLKVSLPILNNDYCNQFYKGMNKVMPNGVQDDLICAGALEGGKDSCQGDSGGPMHISMDKPYCMLNQIAVISFGKFCGFAKAPGIYSRVFSYVPWIESIVWNVTASDYAL